MKSITKITQHTQIWHLTFSRHAASHNSYWKTRNFLV